MRMFLFYCGYAVSFAFFFHAAYATTTEQRKTRMKRTLIATAIMVFIVVLGGIYLK